jgi:peroxiredoxin Q/BCP
MVRIALVVPLLLTALAAGAAELTVGSKAPPFSLVGSDGRTHTLAEHAGERGVVLAWFPKAFTPG